MRRKLNTNAATEPNLAVHFSAQCPSPSARNKQIVDDYIILGRQRTIFAASIYICNISFHTHTRNANQINSISSNKFMSQMKFIIYNKHMHVTVYHRLQCSAFDLVDMQTHTHDSHPIWNIDHFWRTQLADCHITSSSWSSYFGSIHLLNYKISGDKGSFVLRSSSLKYPLRRRSIILKFHNIFFKFADNTEKPHNQEDTPKIRKENRIRIMATATALLQQQQQLQQPEHNIELMCRICAVDFKIATDGVPIFNTDQLNDKIKNYLHIQVIHLFQIKYRFTFFRVIGIGPGYYPCFCHTFFISRIDFGVKSKFNHLFSYLLLHPSLKCKIGNGNPIESASNQTNRPFLFLFADFAIISMASCAIYLLYHTGYKLNEFAILMVMRVCAPVLLCVSSAIGWLRNPEYN